jgi:hypothetical protein
MSAYPFSAKGDTSYRVSPFASLEITLFFKILYLAWAGDTSPLGKSVTLREPRGCTAARAWQNIGE